SALRSNGERVGARCFPSPYWPSARRPREGSFPMKQYKPPDPIAITAFSTDGVMLEAHHLPNLIQHFKLRIWDYFPKNHVFWPAKALFTLTCARHAHRLCFQRKDS